MTLTTSSTFESHLDRSVQTLRGALTELIAGADASPNLPQIISRDFGLNKNLTWKIARTIAAVDSFSAVQHIPGATGMEIFIKGFEKAGVEESRVEAARNAMREFDRVIDTHMGDRATLELVLDSMGVGGDAGQLEMSRRLAFRGNSGIWGVQARVMSTLCILAPNKDDPTKLDVALIGGFVGFRRLRPGASWPLFKVGRYHDDGTPVATSANSEEAVDPGFEDGAGLKMMPAFCSGAVPEIEAVVGTKSTSYSIGPGPVGNTGVFDCFFGNISRACGNRYRTEDDQVSDLFSVISAPVETLLFDVIVHRDLGFMRNAELAVYARPTGNTAPTANHDESTRLPISEKVKRLGDQPPVVATPLIPRYKALVQTVFDRAEWNPSDFFGLRVTLKYPPMPSIVVLGAQLDEQP